MNRPTLEEQILALFEQFERERNIARARKNARNMTLADRLDDAGRLRAHWKDVEADLPDLIRAAADEGMDPREISDRLGISHASGYVARKLREARDARPVVDNGGHDWHHATPLAGLTCRRCTLAHKFWSGDDCPGAPQQ